MTTLIIARHGNTFGPGDTPTRVGGRTNLPLVEKGYEQARAIGRYLKDNALIPDAVYASKLQRTQETAKAALAEAGYDNKIITHTMFNEIDYGPDENKPEDAVIARIGTDAIAAWDRDAIVPDGWIVDADQIIQNLIDFAERMASDEDIQIALVVTSNGIARFAPYITGDFEGFRAQHSIKLSTGALGILNYSANNWTVSGWNIKP